jgi:hypothetical protein
MKKQIAKRCWDFFRCLPEKQNTCIMAQAMQGKCWLVDISCCKIDKDAPNPLSIKKIICKNCEYYKAFSKTL